VATNELEAKLAGWDLDQIRRQIGLWLAGPNGANLATILAAQRGPDSPSERGDMHREEYDRAYWGRRARKKSSGEIIRTASFFGIGKVGARSRSGDAITLPPRSQWDHYDKHQASAAQVLGIEVVESPDAPSAVKAEWKGYKG
jgi:hypothetical protein